jgi:hypothetical protein
MARPDFDPNASEHPSKPSEGEITSIGSASFGDNTDDNLGMLRHADDTLLGNVFGTRKENSDGTS